MRCQRIIFTVEFVYTSEGIKMDCIHCGSGRIQVKDIYPGESSADKLSAVEIVHMVCLTCDGEWIE